MENEVKHIECLEFKGEIFMVDNEVKLTYDKNYGKYDIFRRGSKVSILEELTGRLHRISYPNFVLDCSENRKSILLEISVSSVTDIKTACNIDEMITKE